ncbi:hypothetical protein BOTBODRAFT_48814 [Botryobasidium botryosum FD-172 SS1]|uniref:Crinkler (CRN) family protein n=1 Tax=Botryobasidium botryosum (strain FD-172 SS1) TaxID=930990 RepID=A0A067LVS2_BOTB1|nr:hypothetical protein BOTBODRAFT_48814 [Botryobasidium botryosum FD-172 SS1]
MDAKTIAGILARRFPIKDDDPEAIAMSSLRDLLWGKGDDYLPNLCRTLDSQAIHDELAHRNASPPPDSPSAALWLFRLASPYDIPPEDYAVSPGRTFTFLDISGIPFVPGKLSYILIRDEYKVAFEHISSMPRQRCGGVTICGQPGIGKSLCLYYLLIRRLLMGLPVALQAVRETVLLFLESGTYAVHDADILNFLPEDTWALVDSGLSVNQPAPFLSYPSSPYFIIQAASPRPGRMDWQKYKHAKMFYMRPWDWEEIVSAAPFQPSEVPLTLMGLRFVYNLFGPSARECYMLAEDYAYTSQRVSDVKKYLRSMQQISLQQILDDLDSAPQDHISHQVFCVFPDSESRLSPRHDFLTRYTGRLVLDCWVEKDAKRLNELRATFSRVRELGPAFGCLFEQFAHTTLSQGLDGSISELPIALKQIHYGFDTGTRGATYEVHFGPRTTTIFDMKNFPPPSDTAYYIPVRENQATFDSIIIHNGRVTLFQVTVGRTHDVSAVGLNQLEQVLPQPSYDLIFIVRTGQRCSGVVPDGWRSRLRLFVMEIKDHTE